MTVRRIVIEQVLGLGVQGQRQLAHVILTVSEKRHLLVGLHPLGLEYFEQAAFRLAVVGLNKAETLGGPSVGMLAGDDLKPAIVSGALLA